MSIEFEAKVVVQGEAVLGSRAYVAMKSENIICMYLDAWGETGRAWPEMWSSSSFDSSTGQHYPCIWFAATEEDEVYTHVEFPELIGWEIFSVSGGKTCAIVLTKGEMFET